MRQKTSCSGKARSIDASDRPGAKWEWSRCLKAPRVRHGLSFRERGSGCRGGLPYQIRDRKTACIGLGLGLVVGGLRQIFRADGGRKAQNQHHEEDETGRNLSHSRPKSCTPRQKVALPYVDRDGLSRALFPQDEVGGSVYDFGATGAPPFPPLWAGGWELCLYFSDAISITKRYFTSLRSMRS